MANFLFVSDPDPVRRQSAAVRARERVAFAPRLRAELSLAPDYAVAWAAAPAAPIEQHCSLEPAGTDCILFGEPHDDAGHTLTAADFSQRQDTAWNAPADCNGYYAALMIHPRHGLRVEADVLGVFPIYYWQRNDVLLVTTSPELFRCHPLFETEVDLHGIAALLLTSGMVGGRTLWRGVRRLAPDHILVFKPGGPAREIAPPPLVVEPAIHQLDDAVARASSLHVSFLLAALRHARRPGLQLSGGLDSRLLAGFVTTLGHRPECLTFGRAEDLDARCAAQVARELKLPQTLCESTPGDYAAYAGACVKQENLSGGLYSLAMGWNISMRPPSVEMDRMVCGLSLDAVIGGPKHTARAGESLSFEQLRIGRLGFRRDQLEQLIADPHLLHACDDIRGELVDTYRGAAETDLLREWRMNLAHRHRFAVGVCAWRFSLFAWPVLPALDRRLIQLAARLPHNVAEKRNVQTRMLVSRFPALARLDIDRNYVDTFPLLAPKLSLAGQIRRRAVRWGRRLQTWLGHEPRFYVRTMEFNGPGWRVVRSLADQARSAAGMLFRTKELERVVPAANVKVRRIEDPIIHSTPLKNTLGVILWLRQHA